MCKYRFNKHCRVAASIAENGYSPSDHIIEVQLMAGGPTRAREVKPSTYSKAAAEAGTDAAAGVRRADWAGEGNTAHRPLAHSSSFQMLQVHFPIGADRSAYEPAGLDFDA